jgi:hypothetical protein
MGLVKTLGLAAMMIFAQLPAQAVEEGVEMMNLGREIGWIQATCVYAQLKALSAINAETGIKSTLGSIKQQYGDEAVNLVRELTFKQYPSCYLYWPNEYL